MKRFFTQAVVSRSTAITFNIRGHGDWHAKIWQAFRPVEGDDAPRSWLYSVEELSTCFKALILSDNIPTRPEWCGIDGWATKEIPDGFLQHPRYSFQLTANPTRTLSASRKRMSLAHKTSPIEDVESNLMEWIDRKGENGGFRVVHERTSVTPIGVEVFSNARRSHRVTISYVRFQGVLEVIEPDLFTHIFNSGIGRSKSYGAGMLLLKPIQ